MELNFKKDDKFEDLGSFEDFFSQFGDCTVSIANIDARNIPLIVNSNQQIDFKIYCSKPLSDIIRTERGFPVGMEGYRILRIKRTDGRRYIRVSQSIDIELNQPASAIEYLEKNVKGNVSFSLSVDDLSEKPYELDNFDDLIPF